MRLENQRVAILGLGLMGGSLALALRGKVAALLGVDPDPTARSLALQRGIVDQVAADPAELLPDSTLVVLAAPVQVILSLVSELPRLHPGQAVVIDLGSTKQAIAAALQTLPERLSPIGGHPMCGKERGSSVNAEAVIYQNAPFVLVDLLNSTQPARELAEQLVVAVGGRPIWLDPATHDRWVAATSHLPYLIANALAGNTPIESAPLVGPGFRSTARLAPSPSKMMLDILVTNRSNLLANLRGFRERLEKLENALQSNDIALLEELLGEGAARYEDLILPQDKH